ncbi:MAG: PAS domain-containing protein, partial [Deltaproteobacteria bacterium]
MAPVPILLAAIGVLWLLDVPRSFESRSLLTVLNFTFVTGTSTVIALLAGRTFVATGSPGALFLGSGVLLMGAAFLAAPLAGVADPNVTATVHNLGMLAAGVLSLIGAWLSYRPRDPMRAPVPVIVAAYAGSLGFVAVTAYLALGEVTPTFFVQGIGGTPLRQVVLATGAGLFGAAGLVLVLAQGNAKTFRGWYALGLALLGIGLLGVMLQETIGSPIGWAGRIAQYLGSVYLLVASMASATEARRWGLPLEAELREEREQARQLRDARAQLARVLEGSNDGFWDWNLRNGQVDFSDRWAEMFGYRKSELAPSISTWQGMLHPEDREATRGFQKRVESGLLDRYEAERRFRHKDGHWVWVLVRGKVVERDGDGKPTRMAGTYTDITARKEAEAALHETKERLSYVIDGSSDGFWDWDISTGRVKFSRSAASILGRDLDELEPNVSTWNQLIHPGDSGNVTAAVEAHLRAESDQFAIEHRALHKDGRWIWVLDRGKVVERGADGKPLRMAGTYTDITERKQAQEALHASEAKFRELIHTVPALVWTASPDGSVTDCNGAWCEFTGMTREQSLGNGWMEALPPEDRAAARAAVADA